MTSLDPSSTSVDREPASNPGSAASPPDTAAGAPKLRVPPRVLAARVAAARQRPDGVRPAPDRLIPPGRRADRGPELPMVHETFRFLGHQARQSPDRSRLVDPMRHLMQQTCGEAVRVFLREMKIDAFDVWIAYYLLATREQSERGRRACGWLAETLGQALRTHHTHVRDKSGAVMLWSLLHHLHHGTQMYQMYRTALHLMLPGTDRFALSEDGPVHRRSRPEAVSGDTMSAVFTLLERGGPEAERLAELVHHRLQARDERKARLRAELGIPPGFPSEPPEVEPANPESAFDDSDGFEDLPDERVQAWFGRSTVFLPDSL